MSLTAYAKENQKRPGPPCSVCQLPIALLRELEVGRKEHSSQVMSDYLREEHNIRVSYFSIGHHFRQGHKKETE